MRSLEGRPSEIEPVGLNFQKGILSIGSHGMMNTITHFGSWYFEKGFHNQRRSGKKYQPSGEGGAAPPTKSKMAARGPQNGRGVLERCLPLGF